MLTKEEQEAIVKIAEAMRDKEVERARRFNQARISLDTYQRARRADKLKLVELLKEIG